ncbi:MAG: TrbC/VirB2 family protein [Anaerolineae bacterium]
MNPTRASAMRLWLLPITVAVLVGVMVFLDVASAQISGCQPENIGGFNKLLGTLWSYLAGPAGKVIAIALIVFGAASLMARHIGLGVGALVGAFIVAFAATIVDTLFRTGVSNVSLCP